MKAPVDSPGVTPVDELFTYHIFGVPDECDRHLRDPGSYSLAVTGLVERELRLSIEDLRGSFEELSADMILQCMTNVHWGRVRFTGARLLDVLESARPAPGAGKVALRSADGYDTDLALDEMRASPDSFVLAYAMNGEPVPAEHGYPIRLASDGKYGYKWPKWLSEVEVVDSDYRGHYEGTRGWSDEGTRGKPVT